MQPVEKNVLSPIRYEKKNKLNIAFCLKKRVDCFEQHIREFYVIISD